MADEPVTFSSVEQFSLRPGLKMVTGIMTGGTDYDADPGQLADLSSYVRTIKHFSLGACTAAADALVVPRYVNSDMTAAAGGAIVYTWDPIDGGTAAVLANVADTTNMSGYQWTFVLVGTEVTRT